MSTKGGATLREALEIRKRVLGENHTDYAISLNNLAVLYEDMGQYEKAEPAQLAKALEIGSGYRAKSHPITHEPEQPGPAVLGHGPIREGGATLQAGAGDPEAVIGRKHPDYATSLNNLAALYADMGPIREGGASSTSRRWRFKSGYRGKTIQITPQV